MKKSTFALVLAAVMALSIAGGASAQAIVTLLGAPLSVTTQSISFPATMLTGQVQTVSGTTAAAWRVSDPTGTGAGYRVNIRATDFANGTHTLTVANFRLALSDSDIVTVAGNLKPVSSLTSPHALLTTDQTLIVAGPDTGIGTYTLLPTFSLTIPADTYAGIYTATITATIVAGP
jgi:WxL domain surface cell wall-binding